MSNRKILYSLFNNAWRMFQTAVKDHNDTSKLFVLAWFQWIRQKPVGWGFCLCSTSKCALCVLVQLLESDLPVASSPPQIDPQSPQNETIQLLIFLCFLLFLEMRKNLKPTFPLLLTSHLLNRDTAAWRVELVNKIINIFYQSHRKYYFGSIIEN